MQRETKNVITRETVAIDLRSSNAKRMKFALYLGFAMWVPIGLCAVVIMFSRDYLSVQIKSIALMIFVLSFFAYVLITSLSNMIKLKRGEFEIVVRRVINKKEKLSYGRHVGRNKVKECLYFNDFNETSVKHTMYQLASYGDEFYIVHYRGEKKIKLLYPCKMYEYK